VAKRPAKKGRSWRRPFGSAGSGSSRTGSSGRRRWLLRSLIALFVLWLIACFLVVVEPTVNKPTKVDAILVLGPPDVDGRVAKALDLARQRYAGTVVISTESDKQRQLKSACRNDNPAFQVICFQPSPATTRGEAEEIGRLAKAHHWTSIMVVTSIYHVSRARLIVERCLPTRVEMVAAPGKPSVGEWAYQFLYQTGGFVKALVHRAC